MQPNPALRRLGYSPDDRLVIIHTDDIGMCHSSILAFSDLHAFGLISSGAVMVPCPWFLQAAQYAREHPDADLGVHLTLTSEWPTYRWGPISTRELESGLIDEEGYFQRFTWPAMQHGKPAFVQREIEAQVERAVAAGMQPTHADTHMGVLGSEKFMAGYVKMALRKRLPLMLFRLDEAGWRAAGLNEHAAAQAAGLVQMLDAECVPMLDAIRGLPLDQPDNRLDQAKAVFSSLQPGITHFIIHPSVDTPELRAITPDWPSRMADYQTFLSAELKTYLRDIGMQVIGYREIQQIMPEPALANSIIELLP